MEALDVSTDVVLAPGLSRAGAVLALVMEHDDRAAFHADADAGRWRRIFGSGWTAELAS
jgi:hypothetical protein